MLDVSLAPQTPPLVGRGDELLLIERLLAGGSHDGSALALSGEPGVGKTAVLQAAVVMAEAQGFTVLIVHGVEFEAELTFAGLHQLLLTVDTYASHLSETHQSALDAAMGVEGSASADALVVSAAVVALLRAAAVDKRLLLVVDDLQWLDRASARVLTFVARRVSSLPAVMLCAARDNAIKLLMGSGLIIHRLLPLAPADASELLRSRHPTLATPVRERLLKEANGNPLALLELPSALSAEQRVNASALPDVLPLNDRLKATFGARFGKLPESTKRIVLRAALTSSDQVAALNLNSDVDRDLAALQIAQQERLVRIDNANLRLNFAHPLIRTAVVELSTAAEVRAAHLALAEHDTIDPDRRAWHLAAAAVDADESIAFLLEKTALRNLQRGDTGNAVETMLRAAELTPDEHERDTRLLRAGHLATITGEFVDLDTLLARARADGGPEEALYATATAAISGIVSGNCDVIAAQRMLSEVIRTHAGNYQASNAALMAAVGAMSIICPHIGQSDAWQEYISIVDRLTPRAPRDTYLMRTLFVDPAQVNTDALEELHLAIAGLTHEAEQQRVVKVATAGIFVDAMAGCIQPLLTIIGSSERAESAVLAGPAMTVVAAHAFATGKWDEAEHWHDKAIDQLVGRGFETALLYPHHYRRGKLAALRGDFARARDCIDVVVAWASPRRAFGALDAVKHIQTLVAISAGDFDAAYATASAISPPGQFPSCVPNAIEISLDLVEACVRTGRQAEAVAHVTEMRRLGIARLSSRCALRVAGCTAIAAANDEATALFEIALATPEGASWPWEFARIQLAYGQHLRRNKGSLADARRQLTAARDSFDRLGAVPWSTRAAAELRATPASHRRGSSGRPSGLTPQERQIAMLAATGLSNKEIAKRVYLSDRTVGAHLYRVYPKLGITSRAALRDALSDLDAG